MASNTKQELNVRELFIDKCWSYLNDNFHKFTQPNQIKIALALAQKNIPQEHTGSVTVNHMPQVILEDGKPLEPNVGAPIETTGKSNSTTEATPVINADQ